MTTWQLISIMQTKTKTMTLSTMTKATINYVVLDVYSFASVVETVMDGCCDGQPRRRVPGACDTH